VEAPRGQPPYKHGGRAKRAHGGRLSSDGHTAKEPSEAQLKGRARGGGVKSGPAWDEGRRNGTQVSHDVAKEPDIKNMNRKRVVTFNTGGGVVAFKARGGAVEASQKVVKGVTGVGGGGGGVARRMKAKAYGGKPMKEENAAR
jgi:hypothetical protein